MGRPKKLSIKEKKVLKKILNRRYYERNRDKIKARRAKKPKHVNLYERTKKYAEKQNVPFELTPDDFKMIEAAVCQLCGKLSAEPYPLLDRKEEGYRVHNRRVVCNTCRRYIIQTRGNIARDNKTDQSIAACLAYVRAWLDAIKL